MANYFVVPIEYGPFTYGIAYMQGRDGSVFIISETCEGLSKAVVDFAWTSTKLAKACLNEINELDLAGIDSSYISIEGKAAENFATILSDIISNEKQEDLNELFEKVAVTGFVNVYFSTKEAIYLQLGSDAKFIRVAYDCEQKHFVQLNEQLLQLQFNELLRTGRNGVIPEDSSIQKITCCEGPVAKFLCDILMLFGMMRQQEKKLPQVHQVIGNLDQYAWRNNNLLN